MCGGGVVHRNRGVDIVRERRGNRKDNSAVEEYGDRVSAGDSEEQVG